jgi:HAE1 family hydrophobic/amphiphilic exporter-1
VELLPRLPHPRLTVLTTYEHASPQEVESLVTRRVEGGLGTVAGLRRLESVSAAGLSQISLIFDWGRELGTAAAEVREKLDAMADQLPREVPPPLVLHYDPSEAPIVTLGLIGPENGPPDQGLALRQLATTTLKTRLETLEGVAAVRVSGGLAPEVQVWADRGRLAAQKLDLGSLVERLNQANHNAPAGELSMGPLELPVRTVGRFQTLADVAAVPLAEEGSSLTLGQVAEVRLGHKDQTGFCRVDGRPAVLLSVLKEQAANTVEVSRRVRELAGELSALTPAGWSLTVVDDQAPFIEDSLGQLRDAVLIGGLLAFLVLVAFLRRPRAALLVVLAAPVSLLTTLGFMHLARVGLNLMSIGGLALGVGMLVDSSIVVLEAFHRHLPQAGGPEPAARTALKEVRGALVTATLTIVAVLVPVLFMTGLAQRLFRDFAFTLVSSLLMSLLTALFLLPALLVRLGSGAAAGSSPASLEGRPTPWAAGYARLLDACLARPGRVALLGAGALLLALLPLWLMGASLLPEVSGGRLLVQLSLPPESGLAPLTRAVDRAEAFLRADQAVAGLVTRAGTDPEEAGAGLEGGRDQARPYQAMITARLKPGQGQGRDLESLVRRLEQGCRQGGEPGLAVEIMPAGNLAEPGREGLAAPQLVRLLGEELPVLRELAAKALGILGRDPHLAGLTSDGAGLARQLQVVVDRPAAAQMGFSVNLVAQEVRRAVQGEVAGKLPRGDQEVDIRVRLRPVDRQSPEDLGFLVLRNTAGAVASLSEVARVEPGEGPQEILRQERRRTVLLRGQVTGLPFSLGQDRALEALAKLDMPQGYEVRPGSQRLALTESLTSLAGALLLALMLIYVILVVQFESLGQPLVILLALPPVALGPAAALWAAGIPLSALALLGAVVLMGMAVNTSILLVDYANQLVAAGLPRLEALGRAARVRLRPILMTTLTTVLGALPLCLGWGEGSSLGRPLALTVVAGLAISLLATLCLVPALYLLLGRQGRRP